MKLKTFIKYAKAFFVMSLKELNKVYKNALTVITYFYFIYKTHNYQTITQLYRNNATILEYNT